MRPQARSLTKAVQVHVVLGLALATWKSLELLWNTQYQCAKRQRATRLTHTHTLPAGAC